jgi:hypothetical protein
VMKPKPLSSLNHFTVPSGMTALRMMLVLREGACETNPTAVHFSRRPLVAERPVPREGNTPGGA